ncbi:glycine C-acetyltransferase [Paenibacillus eucommiae]|uniref:2-amino-3-ketobutyrate coenzyme A ligase n=1 Tax=Paenibacillus eucommiae TaxID=1355755 RepID=A0ABS4ILS5_9BACL|nr:glycine C-acetyltransferase [Paenibacillus eucommiae]MBP1988517.1 glycine C-acetyltransferase [Paenibacillus eucommiae]
MFDREKEYYQSELENMKKQGLWKEERVITGPQDVRINVEGHEGVLNMCANNYLGLSNHPEVIAAAKASMAEWGYGLSSVRFICGTQQIHTQLEHALSEFLETEDTLLYSSCFDANGGLFETLLSETDAVISDELNHASIIDGIRLCKASRYRYKNNDMKDLEQKLKEAQHARFRLIVTDGVFSMEGSLANLKDICDLADTYKAMVMVDDSHAVGFIGSRGRGTPEYCGVSGRVDIITGTLGKALGGASGGYTSGRKEIIALLRQRSRPYLFSNTLAPTIAATSLKVLELLSGSTDYRDKLHSNTIYFREGMVQAGFPIPDGVHPIVPIMVGEAAVAQEMAKRLLEKGVYVIGFFYPVVPQGAARIRIQISSALSIADLDAAIQAFREVKMEMGDAFYGTKTAR